MESVAQALEKPWQAPVGQPRDLDLREAVFATLVYARHLSILRNIIISVLRLAGHE